MPLAARMRAWCARSWRQPGRWPRLLVLAAFALILGMYASNHDMGGDPVSLRGDGRYRPVLARGDGHMLYLIARSTALDGDWVFDNDLARFGDPWNEPRTATGRKRIVHPIGAPLVWAPLILLAQGAAVVANQLGAGVQLHGYTLWHQRLVFLSSAVFACLAVWLGRRVARRAVGGRWGPSYAAVAVLLGTPLTYYATYMPSYAHALDAFTCAAFLGYWALTCGRRDRARALALGALLGVATLVRVQEVALGVTLALELVVAATGHVRARAWRAAVAQLGFGAAVLAVAALVFVPQLVEWKLVFGSMTELPQGARYTRLEAPMIGELLFSARNGWFSTTPVAYLATLGLFVVPRRARMIGGGLALAVLVQVYLNSTVFDWWAGASFGQRRMCNVTLALVVGLSAAIWRAGQLAARLRRVPSRAWHGALVVALLPLVAWNVDKAFALRGGKPAPSELSPSCCDSVPPPLRGAARWVYDRIGNPFQLPASALFAARHDVDLRRWDQVVGSYPFVPPWTELDDAELARHRGVLAIGSPGAAPLLVRGLSGPARAGRALRWTTSPTATVLVPNLLPYGQRLILWLAPGGARAATVRWNGRVVARPELTGWTAVTFALPDIELHTNELTVEAPVGPAPSGSGPSPPTFPVGVAVGDLELALLPR